MFHTATAVEYYGYREARARDVFMQVKRTEETKMTFERMMMSEMGIKKDVDNHTTFALKAENGVMIYITCSDAMYYIGTSIKIGSW